LGGENQWFGGDFLGVEDFPSLERRCVSDREAESVHNLNEHNPDQDENEEDEDDQDQNLNEGAQQPQNDEEENDIKSDDEDDGIVWLKDDLFPDLPKSDVSNDFLWKIERWEYDTSENDLSEAVEFKEWSDVTPLPNYGVVILGCM